jgi:hypothetical protein
MSDQRRCVAPAMTTMDSEATYVCDNCGEEIVLPIDPSAGSSQEYVEDNPHLLQPKHHSR